MENKKEFKRAVPYPKSAYLTFDDGPNDATDQILRILADYKAVATFFMLEPNMRRYPRTVKRMIRAGHAVGLHGVTHQVSRFYASKRSVVQEMKRTRQTLRRITGKDTVLIRVPYGSSPYLKRSYLKALKSAGYRMWDWNVDSLDWKYKNRYSIELIGKKVNRLGKLKVSPVILLHDQKETAAILPDILMLLKKRGYVFRKLSPSLSPVQFVHE
ncbi:polysaccharide deacetylase family protein [Paenibacillus hamazuiensis]|uniref:polysaccharide deacetylase family protein n=1 Tax=Paenibacillus hamazuiensis TaxID=2936508 RepID=UPI00200FD5C7|nr:polysaccharide deacetylase family protein [Paenibacillus hamazuiensis]